MAPKKKPRVDAPTTVEVCLVCCGEPKKSMGWFHLTQLVAEKRVSVLAVVEPWFLGAGAGKPGSEAFGALRAELEPKGVKFCAKVEDVPAKADKAPRLFLIAGRTCDAPSLFTAAIERGATHIYVEKPGATSAADLAGMRDLANARGVQVVVGYNKNVAAYARDGMAELRELGAARGPEAEPPRVFLEHCNAFAPGEELVGFLRGPGGEGMLHNMCCHELALMATLFGVSCERLTSVTLDRRRSELVDLGDGRSDWERVAFTLALTPPTGPPPAGGIHVRELTLMADRCGGNFSRFRLSEREVLKVTDFRLPDAEAEKEILAAQADDPEIRPYFLQQAPDYARLKSTFVEHILAGKPGIPDGVVGLDGALEALRLADLLAPVIKSCWEKKPYVWEPPASA